jgi:hypothetical protein
MKTGLKGHANEADFPRILHKLVRHRSLTLHFEPFRFWLRIRGDICKQLPDSLDRGVAQSLTPQVGESAIECLKENSPHR